MIFLQLNAVIHSWSIYLWLNVIVSAFSAYYCIPIISKPANEWTRVYAVFCALCALMFFLVLAMNVAMAIATKGSVPYAWRFNAPQALLDLCNALVHLIGVMSFQNLDVLRKKCPALFPIRKYVERSN